MERTAFFDHFERTWITHQTDHGQQADPFTGLPSDQILDRVSSWLSEFNPLISPESQVAESIRVGIVQRFYGWQ